MSIPPSVSNNSNASSAFPFMPVPGTPFAITFDGTRVRAFIDSIRRYGDSAGLSENEKVDQLYYYSNEEVQDTIRYIPELDVEVEEKTWAAATKKLIMLYGAADQVPTVTLADFQAFCQNQNEKGEFTSRQSIGEYVRKFETYSAALVKKKIITAAESDYYFIAGLPEAMKRWLETQIPANKKTRDNVLSKDEVLTYLYQRFDSNSVFYTPWRQERRDDEEILLDNEGKRKHRGPKATNTQPKTKKEGIPDSTLDSLVKQLEQLTINQAQMMSLMSTSQMSPGGTRQSDGFQRPKRCFMCGIENPPHQLHPSKCPETMKLVSEGLVKYDAQRERFVMPNGADLPRVPYGQNGGISAYIRELQTGINTAQNSRSAFQRDVPPHQSHSANHCGVFVSGVPLFDDVYQAANLEFTSDPALRSGKDTNVRFDPLGSAKRDEKSKQRASEPRSKPTPSSSTTPPRPQPEKKIDVPVPPNPVNRKDGWKQSIPSTAPKGMDKEDVRMKDDKPQGPRYHFTSDLQEKSDPTSVFNSIMNQAVTVPVYQLIGNSPSLQKLFADATRTRREYATKIGKYSTPTVFNDRFDDDTRITSVTMTMVDDEGQTRHYKMEDLDVGDSVVADFLAQCAGALLKSPEATKLFAMVTGIIEITINGVTFFAMIDTGSELNVGSIDLPDRTGCAVDFGGRNWSLKGIHGQPEPLQGVIVGAPMRIGGHDFPHHIFISHEKMEKQDIILGQPFLVWYGARLQYQRSGHVKLYLWEDPDVQKAPSISISITNPKDPRIKASVNASHFFLADPDPISFKASVEEVEDDEYFH